VLPQLPPYQMNRDDDISLLENIILNPLLIPRINSIAISAKGEFIVAGSADKNLYFLHSWDDVIEDVVDDNTYVNTIPITYAIIHDPSGDSSYAYLGQSTENEIDFSNSLEVGREIGIEAKIGWCGVGVGYYQNISTTTSYSNDVYIDYRLNEQVSSQQLSNKEKIGPGHGDTYWIEEWNIPYQLVNRTLKLGDVIIFSHPVFKFGVIRQHTVFISADTINKTYQEPWRTQLLNLNIGYDNKIDPKESPFVKYIDYIHFEGGISYLYDETITETHSRSFSFDFGIKEAAATELGLDFIPGVTGQALIKTSLTFGAGITSKTSQVKERACTLYDAVSYGENLDNLSIIFYQDKIFGTLLFITDKNTSYTSGPHEYWTQKADAVPPAVNINQPLEGQQVQGTVWIVVSATDNDPNKFYQIFIDNVEKFNTTTQDDNIQWPWDTTSYPDGSHVIKAQVTDSSGNTGSDTHTVTVNNYYYHYFKPRSFTTSFPMQSNYVASR
jgi:hypothetical protein